MNGYTNSASRTGASFVETQKRSNALARGQESAAPYRLAGCASPGRPRATAARCSDVVAGVHFREDACRQATAGEAPGCRPVGAAVAARTSLRNH